MKQNKKKKMKIIILHSFMEDDVIGRQKMLNWSVILFQAAIM